MRTLLFCICLPCLCGMAWAQQDGLVQLRDAQGRLTSEGQMVGGKPDGYWKTYYASGALKSEGNRANFLLDSLWRFYTEDSLLTQEITYREGKRNGPRLSYDEQGKLAKVELFKDDVLWLRVDYYYPSGKVKETVPIDTLGKGREHGVGYEFDEEDGRIIAIVLWSKGYVASRERINRKDKFGQRQGEWKEFYDNLSVREEGKYRNDKKHGYWKVYDEEGQMTETQKYEDGILIPEPEELVKLDIKRTYHSNAQVKSEGSYSKGLPEGVHRIYGADGKVESSVIYRKGQVQGEGVVSRVGKREGDWKEYYETGELRAAGKYKDGLRTGIWKFYYPDGKLEQEGNYRFGKPDGDWKWFYHSGGVWREEVFYEGLEEGLAVEYGDTGAVVAKGQYMSGEREGPWVIDVGEHREEGEFRLGERHGRWKFYFRSNGKLKYEGKFTAGREEGRHTWYYESGQVRTQGSYKFGEKEGDWYDYNEDGTVRFIVTYDRNKVVKVDGVRVSTSVQ